MESSQEEWCVFRRVRKAGQAHVHSTWHHGGDIKQRGSNYRAKRSVVRKTSQRYAADCCVCIRVLVWVRVVWIEREQIERVRPREGGGIEGERNGGGAR